jgi:hypothetical protein
MNLKASIQKLTDEELGTGNTPEWLVDGLLKLFHDKGYEIVGDDAKGVDRQDPYMAINANIKLGAQNQLRSELRKKIEEAVR